MNTAAKRLLSISLTLVLLISSACNKQENGAPAPAKAAVQLSGDPLLKKIPLSTAVFGIEDFGGEGYKLFSQSAYGKTKNAKEALNDLVTKIREAGAGDELVSLVQRVLNAGTQLGLISPEGAYTVEKVIARAALFVGPATSGPMPVEAGVFIKGANGVNLVEKLDILKTSLSGSNLQIADETIANSAKGFTVGFTDVPAKVYFAANADLFGVAFSKANLEGLFGTTDTGAIEAIQALAEYKQSTKPLATPEKPLSFLFASLTRLKPIFDLAAQGNQSNEINPAELPVDAVAVQSSFPKQYIHNLGLAVSAKNENQTKILAALEGSSLSPATLKLPQETALSLALDTKFLSKLDPMIKSIEESAPAGVAEQAKKLESLTLGIRNNAAGSPIPDVFLMMQSSGRDQLKSLLESSLGMTMSLVGQNAAWQTKDIDGNQARYFTTLIGAGVYMSAPNNTNNLVIGSSETALKDLLATQSGKSDGIISAMPSTLKTQVSAANLASFYFNFKKVAEVLDSVKNTLAMFTGGNSELNDLLSSANISSWGIAAGAVSYSPGTISINSSFEEASRT